MNQTAEGLLNRIERRDARAGVVGLGYVGLALTPELVARYDCVAILTDHRAFDYTMLAAAADLIVDSRNAIKAPLPHVFRLGSPRPSPAAEGDQAANVPRVAVA